MPQRAHLLGSLLSDEGFDPGDRSTWPRAPQNQQDRRNAPDDAGRDFGDEDDYPLRHPQADELEAPGRIAD